MLSNNFWKRRFEYGQLKIPPLQKNFKLISLTLRRCFLKSFNNFKATSEFFLKTIFKTGLIHEYFNKLDAAI